MARIETWVDCNLGSLVKIQYLDGNIFSMDNKGNLVGVNVYDENKKAVTLNGTCSAHVIRANGDTVAVSGTVSGNKCYVVLPQAAYYYPGPVAIIIKLTDGSTITTLAAIVSNVYQSITDAVVDPGNIIPSVEALIEEIEQTVATIPPDYSNLSNAVANIEDFESIKGEYTFTAGRALNSSGAIFSNGNATKRIATEGFINVSEARKTNSIPILDNGYNNHLTYSVTNGYRLYVCFYSSASESAYIGTTNWLTGEGSISPTGNYMRVCYASVDDSTTLTTADANKVRIGTYTALNSVIDKITKWGAVYKGGIAGTSDLNDYTEVGIYTVHVSDRNII